MIMLGIEVNPLAPVQNVKKVQSNVEKTQGQSWRNVC